MKEKESLDRIRKLKRSTLMEDQGTPCIIQKMNESECEKRGRPLSVQRGLAISSCFREEKEEELGGMRKKRTGTVPQNFVI